MPKSKLNYRMVVLTKGVEVPYMAIDGNNDLTTVSSFHVSGSVATVIDGKLRFSLNDQIDFDQVPEDSYQLVNDGVRRRPIFRGASERFSIAPKFEVVGVRRGFEQIQAVYEAITPLGGIIAGGWAAWMAVPDYVKSGNVGHHVSHIRPKDADIFCTDLNQFFEIDSVLVDELGFAKIGENSIVSTYSPPLSLSRQGCPVIQLITPRDLENGKTFGHPEEIIDSFDFSVARAALMSPTSVLIDPDLPKDYATHRLVFKNIHCPVGNMARLMKYSRKDFLADPYQYFLIVEYAKVVPSSRMAELQIYAKRMSDTIDWENWNDSEFKDRLSTFEMTQLYLLMYVD